MLSSLWIAKLWGFVLALGFLPSAPCVLSSHVVVTFVDPIGDSSTVNNHLVVHKETGILYVGAVNRIYQLDPNLRVLAFNRTGPSEDSLDCSGYRDCPVEAKVSLTNNVNKALVVDYSRAKVIACGSLYQGICWILGLDNVSNSETEFVEEPIVANNETASTVAFIAPGPPSPPTTTVIYVGVTYTGNSPYRHEVPAVSSRSLNPRDNFHIVQASIYSGTKIHVSQRESYPINYVYGFSSEGFSYFMTTQKKDVGPNSPYISKLVRVCQNDSNYYSYTEIPIECFSETMGSNFELVQAAFVGKPGPDLANKLDVTHQDDVLFAVFAKSEPSGSPVAGRESALCVYSLKDIRRKFVENIELCFQGKGNRGLGFIAMNAPCVSTKFKMIEEDFCGIDANTPLGGEKPMLAVPVLNFTTLLTSVSATSAGNYTVVFLGTKDGHLKKVVVESGKSGTEYADQEIDPGSRVLADMFFDPQKSHLYVMTERKISKVLVQNCSEYQTCVECVDAGDPYCGWCSLQNTCTIKNNCPKGSKSSELSLNWISYKSGRCARIIMVTPNQLQSSASRKLAINIDHLPTRSGEFWCVFRFKSGKTLKTHANLTSYGVICYSPPTTDLPPIPPWQHNFTATLSVRMSQEGSTHNDFVGTDFVFFDCNRYTGCTSCVISPFPCNWCVDKHRCTHDTAENCRNDILVTGLNRVGPSIRSGPGFCPRINMTNGSSELLVPYGTMKRIRVKVDNIAQQMIVQTRFSCRFYIEGREIPANAQLVENTIYCDSIPFNYNSRAPYITVPFAIVWGGGETKSLDNPDNIHILVYRCPAMADNCGMCLGMDEKYGCGWCQSSNRCQVREQCDNGKGVWLSRNQTCPNPEIRSFYPTSGPWEGGTNVTIEGINLGKTFDDIYSGVTVAGVSCEPYRHLYLKTRKIVCRLDGPGNNEPKAGPIIVKVADFRAESTKKYRFVDPKIKSINPTQGPEAGGTRLTIYGDHLDAGSNLQAFVGNIPCIILLKANNRIECGTGSSTWKGRLRVTLKFDWGERVYESGFSYVDNPTIYFEKYKPIRGIPAGGLKATIEGMNFDVVQKPHMYVSYNGSQYNGSCNISSKETLICFTPSLDEEPNFDEDENMRLQYGFILDTVDYKAYNDTDDNHSFILFPNPEYDQFDDGVNMFKGEYLTLNGTKLDVATNESEVEVRIGNGICHVVKLSKNQLICRTPSSQPPDEDDNGNIDYSRFPMVKVKVGANLEFLIGRLRYDDAFTHSSHITTYIISGVAVGLFIFGLVSAIVLIRLFFGSQYVILSKEEADNFRNGTVPNESPLPEQDFDSLKFPTEFEIGKERFEFISNLGKGNFGLVRKANMHQAGSEDKRNSTLVAVKTPLPGCPKEIFNSMLSELKVFCYVGSHPNVLGFLGAYTQEIESGIIYIATELCEKGSLKEYLAELHSPTKKGEEGTKDGMELMELNPDLQQLSRFAKEIALGMEYLESQKIIHGDLATRNVLLNSILQCKIGDFGLSRKLYNYVDYIKSKSEPLPWRWLAIESLKRMEFSTKSDVWSYGITLWEIFSLGNIPYPTHTWTEEFLENLENGYRLSAPTFSSPIIYEEMKRCWDINPAARPSFTELAGFFDTFTNVEYADVVCH